MGGRPQARRRAAMADCATKDDQCHPKKIFVGGLGHKLSTQSLRDYFSRFGQIVDAVVLRWPDGRSRGFGYVTFGDAAAAASALEEEAHEIGGREVDVKRAVPGTNKLFVGGLPQNVSALELRKHFEDFGMVSDAVVMIDPATNRSRGFGFICFLPGPEGGVAVDAALRQYDNHRIRGKWIEVKSAAPPHKLLGKEGQDGAAPGRSFEEVAAAELGWAMPAVAPMPTYAATSVQLAPREEAGSAAPLVRPLPPCADTSTTPALKASAGWTPYSSQWPPAALHQVPWPPSSVQPEAAAPAWTRPQLAGCEPLPSLLASGGYASDSKDGAVRKISSPMKVRISSHSASWGEAEAGVPEMSDASKELQRSLEQLLRLQSEQSQWRSDDTALVFSDDFADGGSPDGFAYGLDDVPLALMEDHMCETKLER